MEVAGVVFRQAPCFASTTADGLDSRKVTMRTPNSLCVKQQVRANRKSLVVAGEFSDKGHLQYYSGPRMAVKEKEEKKEMKKKLKLLKGLSKNLSTFSEMGFGLHPEDGLDQQVKGQMISEATEVLLGQLQKLKEAKMESKRMKKEEKAKKKASRMTECKDSSSSSSESSSSESDCGNVVSMSQLKTVATANTSTHQEATSSVQLLEKVETTVTESAICKVASNVEVECGKKIEVCMGGKCKKSGAAVLLESFEKAVGGEAEVVGCKCMGKCRDGPNVKVRGDEVAVANSLCIGVGLEDIDTIVTNFFGGSGRSCSDMVPVGAL